MKRLRISVEGKSYDVEVELLDQGSTTPAPAASAPVAVKAAPVAPAVTGGASVTSPLAAMVVSIDVAIGDVVEAGQTVITLEAMKMNTIVSAPNAGTVSAIHVSASDAVEEGQAMVTLA
jgi:biotin carboxyl carrier protein